MAAGLLGGLGRLFSRSPVPPTETAGSPGSPVIHGLVQDPERNPALQGSRKWKTYQEMIANVSIVAASVRMHLNLLGRPNWTVEPADDSREAEEIAQAIQDSIDGMARFGGPSWRRVVRRTGLFPYFGFSWQEWTMARLPDEEGGGLALASIDARPANTIERWDIDEHGRVAGVWQRTQGGTGMNLAWLARGKSVYAVADAISDSPEGFGLLRHVAEPKQRLLRFQLLEAFGYEMDLRGVPLGRAPLSEMKAAGMSATDIATAINPLTNFIQRKIRSPELGITLDSAPYRAEGEQESPAGTQKWDLSLLTSGSVGLESIAAAVRRIEIEIARILGTEGLLVGGDSAGSLALSRDKSDNIRGQADSTLSEMAEVYQVDVVRPHMLLNGWPMELAPTMKPDKVQSRDVDQITKALDDMARAGAVLQPDDPVVDVIRDLLGLPHQPEIDLETNAGGALTGGDAPDDDEPVEPREGEPEDEGG